MRQDCLRRYCWGWQKPTVGEAFPEEQERSGAVRGDITATAKDVHPAVGLLLIARVSAGLRLTANPAYYPVNAESVGPTHC